MTDTPGAGSGTTTQRCPACHRLNRVPLDHGGKARCGGCKAPLPSGRVAEDFEATSGGLRSVVIQRWDSLLRAVPSGRALDRATGRDDLGGSGNDPLTWLSERTRIPRDDLDQVRLLRVHLASNRAIPERTLTHALEILDRAHAAFPPPAFGP